MLSRKNILLAAIFAILIVIGIAFFNYSVDPLCYYCKSIDTNHATLNRYYQVAQMIAMNPDAEQVILGSSRGETTSPLWVQKISGLKTLNLSAAGSEFITKKAFIDMALEKTKVQKIIWYADYFELITSNADAKIKNTQIFKKYVGDLLQDQGFKAKLAELQQLIDHNTTEASFAALKQAPASSLGQGVGGEIDYSLCEKSDFAGKETPESLRNEVDLLYDSYVHGSIAPAQSEKMLLAFQELIRSLQSKNISVVIVIPPYHPTFEERLKKEYPKIYEAHLSWIQEIQKLQGSHIEVFNYFAGIPHDNISPSYWNDGVHFTCKGVIEMLTPAFKH